MNIVNRRIRRVVWPPEGLTRSAILQTITRIVPVEEPSTASIPEVAALPIVARHALPGAALSVVGELA
jgi:hypothetical protein